MELLSFLIILITNKMKIITHLSLAGRLLHSKTSYPFSNLFKDKPLHFQDLVSLSSGSVQETNGKAFNMAAKRFNSPLTTAIPTAQEAATRKQQALDFMEKTIAKIGPQKEVRTRFERQGLSEQERKDNTALLMRYIDHILERPLALEVIRMVEKYSQGIRPSQKEMTIGLMLGKYNDQKQESNLFKNLHDYLYHSLNFYSENIQANSQLIDSLLELLATSDPFQITTDSYMHGSFSIDDEDISSEVQGQVLFESKTGGKYFQEVNEEDKDGKEANKYRAALEEAFLLKDKTKFSKLYLRKTAEVEEGKNKEQKLRVATEKVFFRKKTTKLVKNTGPKEEDLRSAYIYELPFTITEAQAEEFIHFLESSRGIKVQSYALFPYKNFIEKQHLDIVFRVPQRYTDKNVHMERVVRTVDIDELTTPNPPTTTTAVIPKKGKRTKKSEFDSVPLENQPHRRKSVTQALLLKIKKQSYSKFNKSSMLLKFSSKQDKEAVLTPESRLYGLNYKHFRNIKFQEGFCKTSVSLIGIPWGCSSKQLQNHLNQALQPSRLSIKVEENCILTKSSIVIQFQHLSEAILAIQKLNNLTFQNKPLRAHLTYGSCKVNNNQYNTNIDQSYDKLKLKIQQSGAHYSQKYQAEESQPSK